MATIVDRVLEGCGFEEFVWRCAVACEHDSSLARTLQPADVPAAVVKWAE